jgi:hypothetical protein
MAPNEVSSLGARVGALETSLALAQADAKAELKRHEAVCEARVAMFNFKQNISLAISALILTILAQGSPVVAAIQRVFGGH